MKSDTESAVLNKVGSNRRSFVRLLAALGIAGVALPGLEFDGKAIAQAAGTEPQNPWKLTLGDPDGPHPPFVSNSRRLLAAPELLDAPDEWIDRSLQWVDFSSSEVPTPALSSFLRAARLYSVWMRSCT